MVNPDRFLPILAFVTPATHSFLVNKIFCEVGRRIDGGIQLRKFDELEMREDSLNVG